MSCHWDGNRKCRWDKWTQCSFTHLFIIILTLIQQQLRWSHIIFLSRYMQRWQTHSPFLTLLHQQVHNLSVTLLQRNCQWCETILQHDTAHEITLTTSVWPCCNAIASGVQPSCNTTRHTKSRSQSQCDPAATQLLVVWNHPTTRHGTQNHVHNLSVTLLQCNC